MMHGYMAFDQEGELLVPFRTWRNTMTEEASEKLTEAFSYHIPQRWSIAHLYQAILKREEHVKDIAYLTTLAGYVHWKLTGEKVLGVGEASGMFPIDIETKDYNQTMIKTFNELIKDQGFEWKLEDIKKAGCDALVVYLGNFGPEISETLLAKHFDGPKMFVAAAEESGDNLLDGRGDAYCGMLNASYNLKLRNIKAYIPEYPVGTAEECADMIHVLIEKNFPHHGAVAFGHFGKTLYEVFKYIGVDVDEIGFNQPKNMLYKTENPFS